MTQKKRPELCKIGFLGQDKAYIYRMYNNKHKYVPHH